MKSAIITGFESFGNYVTNPSKWLALSAGSKMISDHLIHSMTFPSTVSVGEGLDNPGELIIRRAKEIGASAIVSFGIASDAKGFRIERTGTNWVYNEKYCTDQENNRPLETTRIDKEQILNSLSCWDLEKMSSLFKDNNIPLEQEISDNPGFYSCNGLIYRTLLSMRENNLNIPYLFVHFPCTEESIEMIPDFDRKNKMLIKKELTLKALELILKSYK